MKALRRLVQVSGRTVAWCAGYVVAVLVARQFLAPESGLALFWPASGMAALWLLARRSVAAQLRDGVVLLAATVGALVTVGTRVDVALGLGVANVVQPVVFAGSWRALQGERPASLRRAAPTSARGVVVTVCCAVLAAGAGSVPGVWTVAWAGGSTAGGVWLGWVVRNGSSIAVLVLTVTAMLSCSAVAGGVARFGVGQQRVGLELSAGLMLSTLLTVAVFGDGGNRPLAFVALVSAVWFGLRFSPGAAALHGLLQGALAIGLSLAGLGPFGRSEAAAERAVSVQAFVLLSVLLACLLSVSVAERRRLLTTSQQAEARARVSERRSRERAALLEAITNGVEDGLIVVSRDGRVVVSNPAAQAVLGRPVPATVHLSADSATDQMLDSQGRSIPSSHRPSVRALAGEVVPAADVVIVQPTTSARRVVSLSATPVDPTDDPEDRLAVLLVRDVTDERAAFEELKAFAGVVAHDLKNPVAALMSWAEILDDQLDDLPADASPARATLLRIYSTAERTQNLVDDLLLYARAGAGDLHLTSTPVVDLIESARAQLPPDLLQGAVIDVECDDDQEVTVDAVLVRQLFANLLGNALKYCLEPPRVRVRAVPGGDRLCVEIADNGVGIPEEEQERVFEGFYRSSRTATRFSGTGLGLAICARAVRRHGGRIAAASRPGGGTTMTFTLPLDDLGDAGSA